MRHCRIMHEPYLILEIYNKKEKEKIPGAQDTSSSWAPALMLLLCSFPALVFNNAVALATVLVVAACGVETVSHSHIICYT